MPLTNEASYEEVLAKLQELTGINQKSELIAAVLSKGGTVPANPTMNDVVNAIVGIPLGKKSKGGEGTLSTGTILSVTGLDFKPSKVIVTGANGGGSQATDGPRFTIISDETSFYYHNSENVLLAKSVYAIAGVTKTTGFNEPNTTITSNGFTCGVMKTGQPYKWWAFE